MVFIKHAFVKPDTIEARLYQEVLAARTVDKGNTLVVAPTALGKTIVACLVTAHVLEKQPGRKVLFLAPTKPLAVQHDVSFKKFLTLPEEKIGLLTGTVSPKEREDLWNQSTIISATPQTIENDLVTGRISLADVGLLIFDEAHRAVKDYTYVFIAQHYQRQCKEPLILALTASPGSDEEKIQDVCKNLFIKNIEVKSPKDLDVKPYTQEINVKWELVELPKEFLEIKKILEIFLKEQLLFLKKCGYAKSINSNYYGKMQLLELQAAIRRDISTKAQSNPMVYSAASKLAALLKISHAHTLLETQGIDSLHEYFGRMQADVGKAGASKALGFTLKDENIREAIERTEKLYDQNVTHPKLARLVEIIQKQFRENPKGKVIVFNHYRDSAKKLVEELAKIDGLKPLRFVGQATKGERDKGMTQKEQTGALDEFKAGIYNILVATSVAEEGLDIPAVDLVVFYESVPSEIRSIQRRGRTGRFSTGQVVILLAKGTRDETFYWVSVHKERKMHKTLNKLRNDYGEQAAALPQQATLAHYTNDSQEKVLIYVDTREQQSGVLEALVGKQALIKVQQLEIGDYVLSDQIVIERKTTEDFLSSMLDGRLFDQCLKMSSNYEMPLMIIEGNPADLYTSRNIHKNAVIGALTTIALHYRLPVLFTKDDEETAEFLYVTARREQLGGGRDIRLRVGRKGLTLHEQQLFIMESLPMVGPSMARALLKKFGSIEKLVKATDKELQVVENMGPKKAKAIRDVLTTKWADQSK